MSRGGKREGAGRKSKAEEQKVNTIFLNALKELYKKDTDEKAKKAFVIDLADTPRGQMFIAEHLFGKPKEVAEVINHNVNTEVSKEEAEVIAKALIEKYQ